MTPDDIAILQMNSREPKMFPSTTLGYCAHCRWGGCLLNVHGYCAQCWLDHQWSIENRLVCDFVHRGRVVGEDGVEPSYPGSKPGA